MKDLKTLISTVGSVAVFAGTPAAQPMVVTGTASTTSAGGRCSRNWPASEAMPLERQSIRRER